MPKNIDKILADVKKNISPDPVIVKQVDRTVAEINDALKKAKVDAECVKGGSIAKDTFLRDDYDADLFVRFSLEYRNKDISGLLEKVLAKLFKNAQRIHGSRDYFQLSRQKINYEVIPVLMIHASNYQDAQNVTDLSPEHVHWVEKHTSKNPRLKEDIRLAKQFCKSAGVYGAESYIKGFSGHIVDVLVIYYGSFLGLARAFSKLKDVSAKNPVIIDPEKHLANPLKELNASKITPLIIVDPIQKDRNAAAALSQETLLKFVEACNAFLEKPGKDFFVVKSFDLKRAVSESVSALKKSHKDIMLKTFVIEIKTLDGSKDIVGTKVLVVYEDMMKHSLLNGFEVLGSGWDFDFENRTAVIYLIFRDEQLPELFEQVGPPLGSKIDYKNFCDKHSGHKTYVKNDRAYALVPRKYRNAKEFVEDFIRKDFVKARVESIKLSYRK